MFRAMVFLRLSARKICCMNCIPEPFIVDSEQEVSRGKIFESADRERTIFLIILVIMERRVV